MQYECLNCHASFEGPDDPFATLQQGCVNMDGTYQARGGYDLEIVYHECSGATPQRPAVLIAYYVGGDGEDGSAGVPVGPSEPLGDPGAARQREVDD